MPKSPKAIFFIVFGIVLICAFALIWFNQKMGITADTSQTVTPTPVVMGATGEEQVTFHHGFNIYGRGLIHGVEYLTRHGLVPYQFDGPNNKWNIPSSDYSFLIMAFNGYYIYNPSDAKTITLPASPYTTTAFALNKGWNLLWTADQKDLTSNTLGPSLQFMYDGAQVKATTLLDSHKISQKIYVIMDDQASNECGYFKLLGTTDTGGDCTGGNINLGTISKIPAGKAFWVYVF